MDWSQLALFAAACLITGFGKAGFGGGLNALVTVGLLIEFEPQTAVVISLPMLIVADALSARTMWGEWDGTHLRRLLPGMIAGVVIGTYVLATAPSDTLRRIIGALMILFVLAWPFLQRLESAGRTPGAVAGVAAGGAAGITSALAHLGGAPVTAYLLVQRLRPLTFVATMILIFGTINWIKVPAFVAAGVFDWDLQLRLAPGLLLIPLGVALGRRVVTRIDLKRFEYVILALMAVGGLLLVV